MFEELWSVDSIWLTWNRSKDILKIEMLFCLKRDPEPANSFNNSYLAVFLLLLATVLQTSEKHLFPYCPK